LRLIDFVYHSTLGVRVIHKKKKCGPNETLEVHRVDQAGPTGIRTESGPLRAVHLSRHKWPGGLVN